MRLFHYTCSHAARRITRYGTLLPQEQPWLGRGIRLVWLTDQEQPDKQALGLQSTILTCDRTEVRYVVKAETAEPWQAWADRNRGRIDAANRALMEIERKPRHWFVSEHAVPAIRDLKYSGIIPEQVTP